MIKEVLFLDAYYQVKLFALCLVVVVINNSLCILFLGLFNWTGTVVFNDQFLNSPQLQLKPPSLIFDTDCIYLTSIWSCHIIILSIIYCSSCLRKLLSLWLESKRFFCYLTSKNSINKLQLRYKEINKLKQKMANHV